MLANSDTRPIHKSDGTTHEYHRATVFLADYHQEYTGCLTEDRSGNYQSMTDFFSARVIWDNFDMTEARDALLGTHDRDEDETSEAVALTLHSLLPGLPDDDAWDQGAIWMIEGSVPGHDRAFQLLYDRLDNLPSGDDDFFDYWPNTMDMLWDYAVDLDIWQSERAKDYDGDGGMIFVETRQNRVKELFERVWDLAGPERDYRSEWLGRSWSREDSEFGDDWIARRAETLKQAGIMKEG